MYNPIPYLFFTFTPYLLPCICSKRSFLRDFQISLKQSFAGNVRKLKNKKEMNNKKEKNKHKHFWRVKL